MTRSCCAKPIATIIKVGGFEAGIIGLEQAFAKVSVSDKSNDEETKTVLLKLVQQFGNYITPTRENEYKEALVREYIKFRNVPRSLTIGERSQQSTQDNSRTQCQREF